MGLRAKFYSILWAVDSKLKTRKFKRLYPDYEENGYNDGHIKFIWGIKSYDDLCSSDACLCTMNDIEIDYDREKKVYSLIVETAYCFDNKQAECEYMKNLLSYFEKFMDDKGYNKNYNFSVHFGTPCVENEAKSIEELYKNFEIFVKGFCDAYGC